MFGKERVFDDSESQVRSYCRSFPLSFSSAFQSKITAGNGDEYIDFLAGCGALNYGHNDLDMKRALVAYILSDGIAHGLDMHTAAKRDLLETFNKCILEPRGLSYRVQFTGPTGTNANEAALKLARKVTKRTNVIAFTNGYHGVSQGALAATGNRQKRQAVNGVLNGVCRAAYDGYFGEHIDTASLLDRLLGDHSSGVDEPAALIVETVQGEGGLNTATAEWLQQIERLARRHGALFIIDDIQSGCGRCGTFFSFEGMGVSPDIVTMSKSLSGMGLPMAVALIKPEIDQWEPGEHNGTFRGNNHAFVTAAVALRKFWSDPTFQETLTSSAAHVRSRLNRIAERSGYLVKGRGMMLGIQTESSNIASDICGTCFQEKLIIETSGSCNEVVKLLAPLTTTRLELDRGLDILEYSFEKNARKHRFLTPSQGHTADAH